MNDSGQIVGGADITDTGADAFIWDPINGMRALNNLIPANSGWILDEAEGIQLQFQIDITN